MERIALVKTQKAVYLGSNQLNRIKSTRSDRIDSIESIGLIGSIGSIRLFISAPETSTHQHLSVAEHYFLQSLYAKKTLKSNHRFHKILI